MDYKLTSKDKLTELAKSNGIETWNELTEFIKNLPYGRNKNRTDFRLVLSEKKGTCSSKHALLKSIADLNNVPNIDLVIGIYRMTELNTPKIGNELTKNSIEFIPEAHCYLKINGKRTDLTSGQSEFMKIEKDIIKEKLIEPNQVAEFKVDYHKNFIKLWLNETKSKFEFEQIWQIREKCIANLTE
ncbi:hypothetical protein P8625_05515 [Tenacibaculum tangerinum]|uniref:Transglutaminase-like domain-containing protein n=1 Tax=Tenacibaculum tangerinum TaxID=3038772 RepID=A0ABY8L8X1_9FLAO|nr:hypothetical protein [Tenacibaculum tangerinum]WGH76618.1 hypothetical protein P8625_05515 [Tenacibaculum tangerinum]